MVWLVIRCWLDLVNLRSWCLCFMLGRCFLVFVNSVDLCRFSCCMFGLCLVTCLFCSAWLLQVVCWRCCGLTVVCGLEFVGVAF